MEADWRLVRTVTQVTLVIGKLLYGARANVTALCVIPFSAPACYQARGERGLLTNKEDTIPGPSDSIGAPKMYILDQRNLGT